MKKPKLHHLFCALAVTVFVWLLVPFLFFWRLGWDYSKADQIGSLFGSVGALFSALAMILAGVAVFFQYQELGDAKKAFAIQAELAALPILLQQLDARLSVLWPDPDYSKSLATAELIEEAETRRTRAKDRRIGASTVTKRLDEEQRKSPLLVSRHEQIGIEMQRSMSEFADADEKEKIFVEVIKILLQKLEMEQRLAGIYDEAGRIRKSSNIV